MPDRLPHLVVEDDPAGFRWLRLNRPDRRNALDLALAHDLKDAPTPTLTRVSMVAAPWPRPYQAARYSGQAPQVATGAASSRLAHCQPGNCAARTIDRTMTATASGAHSASRRASAPVCGSAPGGLSGDGGAGRCAV